MSAAGAPGTVVLTDGVVDLDGARVHRATRTARLSAGEVAVLRALADARGAVVPRDALPSAADTGPRALDMAVFRLRAKLERDPSAPVHLLTAHGEGYRLVPAAQIAHLRTNVDRTQEPIVGRDAVSGEVDALLRGGDAVALVGPAGVGKTRLAHHVAARAAGSWSFAGVWWVDIDDLAEQAGVGATDLVGVVTARIATAAGIEADGPAALATALARRGPSLVAVDTCDRCGSAIAALARALAGRAAVLVTSRVPVGTLRQVEVEPLAVDDAAALLAARARSLGVSVGLPADRLARVAAAVDGLPLALELAAARLIALPLARIEAELGAVGAARLLRATGSGARPGDRHASVSASVGWSWHMLADEDQDALGRLSVAAGPVDLSLARALLGVGEPGPILARLTASHLVRAVPGGIAPWHAVREVARDRCDPSSLADARARHAAHFVGWARERVAALWGADYDQALAALERHGPDLDAARAHASAHADPDGAAALAFAACDRDLELSRFTAARERAVGAAEPRTAWTCALLALASTAAGRVGRWPEAAELGRRALAAARDDGERSVARSALAVALGRCGDGAEATIAAELAAREAGADPVLRARALGAVVSVGFHRAPDALALAVRAHEAAAAAGCARIAVVAAANHAVAAWAAGDAAVAEDVLVRTLDQVGRRRRLEAMVLHNLAFLSLGADLGRALAYAERALEAFAAIGAVDGECVHLGMCAVLRAVTGGDVRDVLRERDEVRERWVRPGDPSDAVLDAITLAAIGRPGEARAAFDAGRERIPELLALDPAGLADGIAAALFDGAALPSAVAQAPLGARGSRRWVVLELLRRVAGRSWCAPTLPVGARTA